MAIIANLFIDQGTDFTLQLSVVDTAGTAKNLTGATITAQARKDFTSANPTATFTTAVTNAIGGICTISLSAAQTAAIKAGRYVYDVNVFDSANTTIRAVEGLMTIRPEVTR